MNMKTLPWAVISFCVVQNVDASLEGNGNVNSCPHPYRVKDTNRPTLEYKFLNVIETNFTGRAVDIEECAQHCSRTHSCDWFVFQLHLGSLCQLVASGRPTKVQHTDGFSSRNFTACVRNVPGCYLANDIWWLGDHPGRELSGMCGGGKPDDECLRCHFCPSGYTIKEIDGIAQRNLRLHWNYGGWNNMNVIVSSETQPIRGDTLRFSSFWGDFSDCADHCSANPSCNEFVAGFNGEDEQRSCDLVGNGPRITGSPGYAYTSTSTICVKNNVPGCYLWHGRMWRGDHPGRSEDDYDFGCGVRFPIGSGRDCRPCETGDE